MRHEGLVKVDGNKICCKGTKINNGHHIVNTICYISTLNTAGDHSGKKRVKCIHSDQTSKSVLFPDRPALEMFKQERIDEYIPAYKQDRIDYKNKFNKKIPKNIIATEPKSDIPVAAASEPKLEIPVAAAETLESDFEQDMMLLLADDSDF
jgi:hypothetical protein